jgi:hypothetical protein
MSMWGAAGNAAAKYKSLLNLNAAARLTKAGWNSGARGAASGVGNFYKGAIGGAASGMGRWAMGNSMTQRVARMRTIGAGAGAGLMGLGALRGNRNRG